MNEIWMMSRHPPPSAARYCLNSRACRENGGRGRRARENAKTLLILLTRAENEKGIRRARRKKSARREKKGTSKKIGVAGKKTGRG
jgi:hypothetical protein